MGLKDFYERVTEGIALRDLWAQFKSEAQYSYKMYSYEIDWESLERLPPWKRFFRIAWAFFLAMLMHLSPARRVLLLISIVLILLSSAPVIEISAEGASARQSPVGLYGGLGLLLVLALELSDRVIMKRDLQIAREIQQWLVPDRPPELDRFEFSFSTRPANTVGGDYYDVMVLGKESPGKNPERVLLIVADVAGKSVPAALLMATLQASFRALAAAGPPLAELVSTLNQYVCTRSSGGRRFTTAFIAELNPRDGRMQYVNAGHNYPSLRRKNGSIERLTVGGLPLGIQESCAFEVETVQFERGDYLVIFTDGVIESVNETGEEFGEERLLSLIRAREALAAGRLLQAFQGELEQFIGTARQHDDMTWLILRAGKPEI